MSRKFSKKKRNKITRVQKPMILIIAEGNNMTESKYFKSFQDQHAGYNIKVLIPGHITDPKGMQSKILSYWNEYEMDVSKGDAAFIVLDLDCDSEKGKLIRKLAKENGNARFIVSNPCFEVWFLLHFRYSTHSYLSSAETIKDLRNYIPKYEKNSDVVPILSANLCTAMQNAERLKKYYSDLEDKWPSTSYNPWTDVPIIINVINKYKKRKLNH